MRTLLLRQQRDRAENQEKMHEDVLNNCFWSVHHAPWPVRAARDTEAIKTYLPSSMNFHRAS